MMYSNLLFSKTPETPKMCHPERRRSQVEGPAFAFVVAVVCSLFTLQSRHPERSGAESKDPDTLHFTQTDRTVSTENAVAFAPAVASEIGPGFSPDIHGQQKKPGFSPRDMLSSLSLNTPIETTA
jgi:hypothetical protein